MNNGEEVQARPIISRQDVSTPVRADITGSDTSMVKPKIIENRTVALIGKTGTGKSSLRGAFLGNPKQGNSGWRDGNDLLLSELQHERGNIHISLFDAKGCRGNFREDYPILHAFIQGLAKDAARIDCVFLCFSSSRFTPADKSIIQMLETFTTKEFLQLVRVVITHAPDYVLTEEFLVDVEKNLSFLGSSREEILKKVLFVDLINPLTFKEGSAARIDVDAKWTASQDNLYSVVEKTAGRLPVHNILSKHKVQELLIVYWIEAWFCFALVIILVLLALFMNFYDLSTVRLLEIQQCAKNLAALKKQGSQPGINIIEIVKNIFGFFTSKN